MTQLYIAVPQSFSGTANAGSGTVTRWTYTVPTGKMAELELAFCQVNGNGNAAATTQALIAINNGGTTTRVLFVDNSGVANTRGDTVTGRIFLDSGDVVQGFTVNTGAAGVAMLISASVREYL